MIQIQFATWSVIGRVSDRSDLLLNRHNEVGVLVFYRTID